MATTRFDHARFPDPVAHFEKTLGSLRFNGAGWAQVDQPPETGPGRMLVDGWPLG
jgi:hypothetical protein